MVFKLILGYKCNMKCDYCYQKSYHCDNKDISYEVLDKFIERFNKLDGIHTINFFGGEPLLHLDKIKYIIDQIDKKHELSISTNGSLREQFYEIERYWGKPILNLLSNKQHKNYNKLNNLSAFRWVTNKENINELTDELVEFLGYEYGNKLQFKYDMSKKWELKEVEKMEHVQRILKKINGDNFFIDLPVNYNAFFTCFIANNCCFINFNGDYLSCHRNPKSVIGNIFKQEFIPANNKCCLDINTNKVENLYSYGNYKFKGTSLFHACD